MKTLMSTALQPGWQERCARAFFVLAIVALPVTQTVDLPLLHSRLTLFDVAAGTAIALWLLARHAAFTRDTFRLPGGAGYALAAFLACALLSGWNAFQLLRSGTPRSPYLLEVFTFAYLAAFLFAGADLLREPAALRRAVLAWLVACAAVAIGGLAGLTEILTCNRPLSNLVLWDVRVMSTFRNPNQTAAYLLPTCAVIGTLWVGRRESHMANIPLVLLYAAAVVVLVATGSRGGMIAGVLTLALFVVFHRFRWRAVVAALFTGVLVLLTAVAASTAAERGNGCAAYLSQTLGSLPGLGTMAAVARVKPPALARADTAASSSKEPAA